MRKSFTLLAALAALSACGGGGSMGSMSAATSAPTSGSGSGSTAGSVPPAIASAKAAGTAVDPAIVTADNAFGFALFQNLSAGSSGNIVFSPLSAALVLQIAYNGAQGDSQSAMAQALQLNGMSVATLNNDNAALQASLINPDPMVQLTIANSLWSHLSANPIVPAFTSMDENYYGATVGDLAQAPAAVNTWITNATDGLITSFANEPASYYSGLTALLLNAVYFKGQWSEEFDATKTAAAPFTLADGSQVTAQLMHQSSSYSYVQGANFQMARLPYGQGHMSLLVVLPNSGVSLAQLVAGLSIDQLNSAIGQFHSSPGNIALPKFTINFAASLVAPLQSLGMGSAFCPSGNLSGLAAGACLSDVTQQTVIEVDETGTTAASVTGGGVTVTAVQQPFTMTCDHPFLYAIRDDDTNLLLFIGALANPVAPQ
jgi:serine protease inhibitor